MTVKWSYGIVSLAITAIARTQGKRLSAFCSLMPLSSFIHLPLFLSSHLPSLPQPPFSLSHAHTLVFPPSSLVLAVLGLAVAGCGAQDLVLDQGAVGAAQGHGQGGGGSGSAAHTLALHPVLLQREHRLALTLSLKEGERVGEKKRDGN